MPKVILKGYIKVADCHLESIKSALPEHIALTRQEPGCLVFDVMHDAVNPNIFNVYEEFQDQESFDQHQLRAKASAWASVSKDAERHYQIELRE